VFAKAVSYCFVFYRIMIMMTHIRAPERRVWAGRLPLGGVLCLIVFLFSPSLLAAEKTLSLTTALQRALADNPALQVFTFRQEALVGQRDNAALHPALEFSLETENPSGSDFFDQSEFGLALSSSIELGGKRDARLNVYRAQSGRLALQQQVEGLSLLGEVTRTYIELLAAQERVALAVRAEGLAREVVAEVDKRVQTGAAPKADAKRAIAAAAQTHLSVSAAQTQVDYLKLALATLWGAERADFNVLEGDLYQFGRDREFSELYESLLNNPAVKILTATERVREAELSLTRTESRSNVQWSLGLRRYQEFGDTAVTAGLSMPLFAESRNRGLTSAAQAAKNEAILRRDVALLQMRSQLYRAYSNRKQAVHAVADLRRDIIPALVTALSETRDAYRRGLYSYLDYISAEQNLLNAQRTLIDTAAAALIYGSNIEQLSADSLSVSDAGFVSNQGDK
jgi:cobalt-zinc-cadmium efflux system outer membrane protein